MLEKVREKLQLIFGSEYKTGEVIASNDKKMILLIETQDVISLVNITDFTELPIGDYDVFIEHKVKKTGNLLADMTQMLQFIHLNSKKRDKYLQERLLEITNDIVATSKEYNRSSVLSPDE